VQPNAALSAACASPKPVEWHVQRVVRVSSPRQLHQGGPSRRRPVAHGPVSCQGSIGSRARPAVGRRIWRRWSQRRRVVKRLADGGTLRGIRRLTRRAYCRLGARVEQRRRRRVGTKRGWPCLGCGLAWTHSAHGDDLLGEALGVAARRMPAGSEVELLAEDNVLVST